MERTQLSLMLDTGFKGINQLVDDVKLAPAFVPWTFGLMVDETVSVQRTRGKLSVGTGTNPAIMTIRQLTFDGSQAVVIRAGTGLMASDSLASLRQAPALTFPVNPFIPQTSRL